MTLSVVTWSSTVPSGGNTYNRELVTALVQLGVPVRTVRLPGPWPDPRAEDVTALERVLRTTPVALVDGIVGCAAPQAVRGAVDAGSRVHLLVHMPLAGEEGLPAEERARREDRETHALRHATGILCPSTAAADQLRARGFTAAVARPGVRPAAPAPGSTDVRAGREPRVLCLAALSPTKDQLTLVRALGELAHLPWRADLVGPADPGYGAAVRAEIDRLHLTDQVRVPGPLTGTALDRAWDHTDLLVLPSRAETYGLVVTEALARGIPAVVGAGTGAVEALRAGRPDGDGGDDVPGAAVPPGDVRAWADTLGRWLTDDALARRWRRAALGSRERLPTWRDTAQAVLSALQD